MEETPKILNDAWVIDRKNVAGKERKESFLTVEELKKITSGMTDKELKAFIGEGTWGGDISFDGVTAKTVYKDGSSSVDEGIVSIGNDGVYGKEK